MVGTIAEKEHSGGKTQDIGERDSSEMHNSSQQVVLSLQANRRLLMKTNLVILPIMIIASTLAFLDKNAMGFAAVYGMNQETGLKGQQYSWLGSIFYFGYMAMELPGLWLLTKIPMGRIVGTVLVFWGIAIMAMAACHNFAGLATVRVFLGMFEAALLPCCMLLTSIWYRREEQALVTALYFNTFAGIFGGILAYAIGHIDGALSSWKYLFIIYGSVTVLFGIIVVFALPSEPSRAWFFNEEEKNLIVVRTAQNQTGLHTVKGWRSSHIIEALKDPKYWVIGVSVIAFSIANAGITNFNPLIISGYGFSKTKTTLMAAPQAAVAIVAQCVAAAIMLYVPRMRCLLWGLSCLPALAGTIMIHTLDIQKYRSASLTGVYLLGFYNVPSITILSLISSNTAGVTKKSFTSISFAIFYSVGNIIGPQFFKTSESPHYPTGIVAMMTGFSINLVTSGVYYFLCFYENRRRDRLYGKPTDGAVAVGLEVDEDDMTDGGNRNFRYAY